MNKIGMETSTSNLPTVGTMAKHISLRFSWKIFCSIGFTSRISSSLWCTNTSHKQHHEFKANVGIAAEYFHPVEDLFNIIPMITGPLLLKMHFCTFMVWIVIRISEIVDAHSGYALPFSIWEISLRLQGGADRHEFHHSHNKGSYGSFTKFWDWMFNTDAAY